MVEHTSWLERARLRGQFVLGPSFVDAPENWQRRVVGGSLCLTAHPDLPVAVASSGQDSIGLIGYLLDPNDPAATDSAILKQLLPLVSDWPGLLGNLAELGGRWMLIIGDGTRVRLLHDPLGLRQVFYLDPSHSDELWCASQPGALARIRDLPLDEDVVTFVRSRTWQNDEHWLLGDGSPFRAVRHLLPNHYLDLMTGKVGRYWPTRNAEPASLEGCVEQCAATLSGLMLSAHRRFDLAISLTAGGDSRLVLAASKPIARDLICMTLRTPKVASADVEIPARLLKRLGLRHDIVDGFAEPDHSFQGIFAANVPLPHPAWATDAWAILRRYGYTRVGVTGSGGEFARHRRDLRKHESITLELLCSIAGMPEGPIALHASTRWLSELPVYNRDLWDLFRWEQHAGNWLAMCQYELGDVAWRDVFTPYNCRALLERMISVDMRHRWPPRYEFQRRLMRRLWPETLALPINPHKPKPRRIRRLVSYGLAAGRRLARAMQATSAA